MRKLLSYTFLLCGLLNSVLSGAQTISPRLDAIGQKVTNSLTDYSKRYPQEKIFIHTDQNVYLNGQTVWYKAYVLAYGNPSALSKIVYVRLSDADGKIIKEDKLPVKNGTAFGNINLPDSLASGWYQLHAFTAWMLNFDHEDFYHQNIYIKNVHDNATPAVITTAAKIYHIDLFPEGGDMVEGNICNIAFKATDEHGMPTKVYGEVLDDNKKPVAKLITQHDGMGSFEVEALAGANYIASVHFPDSTVQNIALQKPKETGISLRVNTAPVSELEMKIAYADPRLDHKDIVIEAVQNNGIIAGYPVKLKHGINVLRLKKADFSTGILRLTIFDESGRPTAERIVFINNNDLFKLSLTKNTVSFDPKGENVFTLNLKDGRGPVKANLSVSVTDAAMGTDPGESISSYFLVSSELRGYINQPGYYFKNNSDTLQSQLDLVMLTNGWRHFKWDSVLKDRPNTLKYFVENSQMIAGQIDNYHDKDNLKIKLMITNADSSKKIAMITPDSTGCFVLKDYNHQGTANLYFEVVNAKGRKQPAKITFFKQDIDTVHFGIDTLSNFTETIPVIKKTFLDSVAIEQNARFVTHGITLKTVNIRERKLTPTEQVIKSHVHRFELDDGATTFDLVNTSTLPGGLNPLQFILGKVPGLQMFPVPPEERAFIFKYHGPSDLANEEPIFYIDEARVTQQDIVDMPLQDVALIRFAPPPAWFAPGGGGFSGAILIYTKQYGDDRGNSRTRSFDRYTFNGYSITREFPLPDYSDIKQQQQVDYRTTLYWNHDVDIDGGGNFKIRFYNSDKTKKYRVVVQGMDAEGRVGYLSEEF